jgi:8-oxo-dGTP diphosphatase
MSASRVQFRSPALTKQNVDSMEKLALKEEYDPTFDCFILNEDNQIFVQKRSANHRLFPNMWDFPGGHIAPRDSLYYSIFKAIKTELNLDVDEIKYLFDDVEWSVPVDKLREGENAKKVILQFVITVQSMDGLQLEDGEAVDWAWVDQTNLDILNQGKDADEEYTYAYLSAKKLLESLE